MQKKLLNFITYEKFYLFFQHKKITKKLGRPSLSFNIKLFVILEIDRKLVTLKAGHSFIVLGSFIAM